MSSSKTVWANLFFDSGATASNYIRQDIVSQLLRGKDKDNFLIANPMNVCGAFGQCQLSSHYISIVVHVPLRFSPIECNVKCNNNSSNININTSNFTTFTVDFRVLRVLPYELMIGRPDIDRLDLWYLLKAQAIAITTP